MWKKFLIDHEELLEQDVEGEVFHGFSRYGREEGYFL